MSHIGTKFILAEKFTFDPLSNTLIDKEDSEEIIRLGSNALAAGPTSKRGDFSQ